MRGKQVISTVWPWCKRYRIPFERPVCQNVQRKMHNSQDIALNVEKAYARIKTFIRKTPLEYSTWLSTAANCNAYIKPEHEQITNAFKLRGATNKVQMICESGKKGTKIVTASTGNHGMACIQSIKNTDIECIIVIPTNSPKIDHLKRLNVNVKLHGTDCLESEMFAKQYAEDIGATYISPYNNPDVIAGQGTIGLEIMQDLPNIDAIFVSVGGGGLISGIASYLKHKNPKIKVIGCQPENSPVMYKSIQHGSILDMESLETLSDGTAGGVEQDSITFEICRDLVDEWVLVSEDEISLAVYKMLEVHCKVVEGAAGVAIASFLKTKDQYEGKNVVVLSCGANIPISKLRGIIDRHYAIK